MAKKQFSILGLGTFVILGLGSLAQLLMMVAADILWPQWIDHPWGVWIVSFVPLYLIAVPIGILILRTVPGKPLEHSPMKTGTYLITAVISVFMMYAGNLLGNIVTVLLQLIPGVAAENPILSLATDTAILPKVLVMVILAPIIEEYIFRRMLIDRMRIYGEKLAVITSALMFGLFHGNLSQFFYAFALGAVFGYVYLKTGMLRYSIGLHMFINFLGGVVGPFFLEKIGMIYTIETMDLSALTPVLPWLAAFGLYTVALMGTAIAGLVLLCIHRKRITFEPAELELPKELRFRTVYLNAGMILLVLACLALTVLNTL